MEKKNNELLTFFGGECLNGLEGQFRIIHKSFLALGSCINDIEGLFTSNPITREYFYGLTICRLHIDIEAGKALATNTLSRSVEKLSDSIYELYRVRHTSFELFLDLKECIYKAAHKGTISCEERDFTFKVLSRTRYMYDVLDRNISSIEVKLNERYGNDKD